jgi:MGT family glycosyltransferase
MARFLIAAHPAAGHIGPLVPLAIELLARRHAVAWYTGSRYRDRVEATGATYLPYMRARDFDSADLDAEFPGRAKTKGLARFRHDIRRICIAAVPGQVADLEAHARSVRPDVIVAEPVMTAAARAIEERHGIPWATCNVSTLAMRSVDTPPFGLGLRPRASALGRLRNRALNAVIDRTIFRSIDRDYRAMRASLGLEPLADGVFGTPLSPYLYLQPSAPSFEYPRRDLASQVHFIGPLLPPAPADFEPPSWWDELDAGRPVVLVTQGTIATDPRDLLLPALEALRDEPVLVVAVTGGPDPADLPAPPPNARVERFVPFAALMPRVSAMVTNGGYGGLHFALAHGVPLVVVGATEEKPELVARVNWSGVGVGMRSARARPGRVRAAVRHVLHDAGPAARAAAIRDEMARYDGPALAADLLERLVAARRPRPLADLIPLVPPGDLVGNNHAARASIRT